MIGLLTILSALRNASRLRAESAICRAMTGLGCGGFVVFALVAAAAVSFCSLRAVAAGAARRGAGASIIDRDRGGATRGKRLVGIVAGGAFAGAAAPKPFRDGG